MAAPVETIPCDVISTQPCSQALTDNNLDYINGERTIFEATCDIFHLRNEVEHGCIRLGLRYCLLGVAITYPLGLYCGKRVSNSWQLCLTRSGIHYMRKNHFFCCSSCNTNTHVDLSDISKVYVSTTGVENGLDVCNTETLPTAITIELNPDRRVDSGTYGISTCCGCVRFNSVLFTHCANAEEFVQAVQQQMQAN